MLDGQGCAAAPNATGKDNIAGLWHNDRAGNRLSYSSAMTSMGDLRWSLPYSRRPRFRAPALLV